MNEKNKQHPSALDPAILILNLLLAVVGAIIGLELIVRIGISTNTSIVGALFAIVLSRIPLGIFKKYRDINSQNLVQTNISGATFSAANSLILPIGIPYLMGEMSLVVPMLIGVLLATIIDATILYKTFDTPMFPASEPWPPGIASAETILAVVNKGRKALLLIVGIVIGVGGKVMGIPTDLLGVAWIGDIWALGAFGVGALVIGVTGDQGISLSQYYIPHGIMIGAGLVALIQVGVMLFKKEDGKGSVAGKFTSSLSDMKGALVWGYVAYVVVAIFLAVVSGIYSQMSVVQLILWIIFAAFSAIASELIVGMSAMHSGWFPGFATALIFLLVGMLMGFPKLPLGLLAGYTAATGPAFSDMAYDLKCGWILRGQGADPEFEKIGRKQQYIAEMISFLVAFVIVLVMYKTYFGNDMFAPVSRTFVTTIDAGSNMEIAKWLLIFAIPGAVLQFIGGPSKQLGVLFATGMLVGSTLTGITVIIALVIRVIVIKVKGEEGQSILYILGAGAIAGAALHSFFTSTLQLGKKS
ncbi:MAG: OPT family oligopeptide transporter [Hespellia sp.]|jgi:uncharacterized oligopeptide transporter (OPT) family protein|nr:OPT family oligopeptide transporter [Hespellia sp.]